MQILKNHAASHEVTTSSYLVIAVTRPASIPRLREALGVIRPRSVTTSHATTWARQRELVYRGVAGLFDEQAVRVEIACDEAQVNAILAALKEALDLEQAPDPSRGDAVAEKGAFVHVAALSGFSIEGSD